MDVIKSADWVIYQGTEAGDVGGELVFSGKPTDFKKAKESYMARYLYVCGKEPSLDNYYLNKLF